MIYLATVDHAGTVRVLTYKTLPYFLSVAGEAFGVPTHEKTFENVLRAARARNAYAQAFATEWHAATAIRQGAMPPAVADALRAELGRRQYVAARAYGLNTEG